MVPHISKKIKVNFLCQIGLLLGQSLPTVQLYTQFVFCFCFWSIVCFILVSTSLCHSGDVLFPSCPDCSLRAPACKSHQLGVAGCMDLKVVTAHWPSIWGYRSLTEMILDNRLMFYPKGAQGGFVLHVFQQTWFKNSWLHLVGCSCPLFFKYSGTAKNLPQQETKVEKGYVQSLEEKLQFSGNSPKYRCHELKRWGVFQVKISESQQHRVACFSISLKAKHPLAQ